MKTDEHGNYNVLYRFVDTWAGKGTSPGWCLCEVRGYAPTTIDGKLTMTTRVWQDEPQYLCDHPEASELHGILRLAQRGLGMLR